MRVFKLFLKQLFCKHDYGKMIYSHDKSFAFSSCKKCNHQVYFHANKKWQVKTTHNN